MDAAATSNIENLSPADHPKTITESGFAEFCCGCLPTSKRADSMRAMEGISEDKVLHRKEMRFRRSRAIWPATGFGLGFALGIHFARI